MKSVLCYGDSNTWGYIPGNGGRYPLSVRWTGVLQKSLGNKIQVVEEGLSGRYSVWDDPFRPGRKGSDMLLPLLHSHAPLDLVIIMLGTNDILHYAQNTASDAAKGCSVLLEIIMHSQCGIDQSSPYVLLVAPPLISPLSKDLELICHGDIQQSNQFGRCYKTISEQYQCHFIDAGKICVASEVDGVHLDEKGHIDLARALYQRLMSII